MEIVEGLKANTTKGTTRRVLQLLEGATCGWVLDAPAGSGALSRLLERRGHRVLAAEIEPEQFEAREVALVVVDLEARFPLADRSFDYAVCMDGIEHLEDPFGALREFARILRTGGTLILSTPNISALRSRARFLLTGFHNKGKTPLAEERPSPLHHVNLMTFPELRYALHKNSLFLSAIESNRAKAAALPYLLLYPFAALATLLAFRHEHDPRQRELNREIYTQMLSWNVAMGETLILAATQR